MTEPREPLPPAIEAERMVLGAILVAPAALDSVTDILRAEHFVVDFHRRAFAAMIAITERADALDVVSVRHELGRDGAPLTVEQTADLASMLDGIPRMADASHWARIVRDAAKRRFLALLGQKLTEQATREDEPTEELIDRHQTALLRLVEAGDGRHAHKLGSVLSLAVKDLEAYANSPDGITGIATGFDDLDRVLGGWQPGTLNVIAARPRRGKSVLCGQTARHAAGLGRKVLAFTLEMPPRAVGQRLLMAEERIDRWALRAPLGPRRTDAWERVTRAYGRLQGLPLWLDDRESPNLAQIAAAARRMKAAEGLDMLVVDYLQRCSWDRKLERRIGIGDTVKGLKSLALALNIPVLCAVQLNRQAERDKPNLGQLAECGDIEAEADVVAFLHPTEIQGSTPEKTLGLDFPPMELWVEKNRNGSSALVELTLEKRFTRFEARAREEQPK